MEEIFIEKANYLSVTDMKGKVLAHVDLKTGETIQNDGVLVSVDYGNEPKFKEIDGEIYLLSALEV